MYQSVFKVFNSRLGGLNIFIHIIQLFSFFSSLRKMILLSQITKTTLYSLSVLWFSEAVLATSLVALVGACAEVNGV